MDNVTPLISISKAELEAALLGWELDYRAGRCRSHEADDALPAEQLASESADALWSRLVRAQEPAAA